VRQLAESFETTSDAIRLAVEQIRQFATTADSAVQDRQPLLYQINTALQEVSGAARSFRALADYLDRHPEALLFGKRGK
jgi:paraquat-inducible protein B